MAKCGVAVIIALHTVATVLVLMMAAMLFPIVAELSESPRFGTLVLASFATVIISAVWL